jgi:type IV secretory pathway VirB10-like protein
VTDVDLRCPQCGALLRGKELWCSLCHADLRPQAAPVAPAPAAPVTAPDPLTAPVEELLAAQAQAGPPPVVPSAAPPVPDVLAAPEVAEPVEAAESPEAARGKHARPAASAEESLDPDVMLALLRADSRDPVLTKVGGRLGDPTMRFAVMIGGAIALAAVLFGVYGVLGLIVG